MISTILIALAVLWPVVLYNFPGPFASRKRSKPTWTQYSYNVCGDKPMPMWKKKRVSPTPQGAGRRS